MTEYDDDYATCHTTDAGLRIYPGEIDPDAVTERLALAPTRWQRRGEASSRDGYPPRVAPLNGWFLSSKGEVDSRDSRRHIDWLLDRIEPRAAAIHALQALGCRMDISCFWTSQSGHGGPTIPPDQMRRLADLNLMLWFDFYGPYDEDDEE